MGERIGYVRVSTRHQNTARQEVLMEELGVTKIFVDKVSGKDTKRPELQAMLAYVWEGDVLVVESFSRLARSTRDLLDITSALEKKGVKFISKKQNIDTSTPNGRFMLTVFAALDELEREVSRERADEGIAIAKAAGKFRGGVPKPTDWERFKSIYNQWRAGKITAVAAQKMMSMSPATWYRRIRQWEESNASMSNKN